MTHFNLNISRLNDLIVDYSKNNSELLENMNFAYKNMQNVDSAWTDPVSLSFIETVKRDKYKLFEYLDFLEDYYNNVNDFKNQIIAILVKYGYKNNTRNLLFNDEKLRFCKNKLNNALNYLSNANTYLSYIDDIDDYSIARDVRQLRSSINSIIRDVKVIYNNINNFSSSINKLLDNTQVNLSRLKGNTVNIELLNYKWNLQNPEVKSTDIKVLEKRTAANSTLNFKTNSKFDKLGVYTYNNVNKVKTNKFINTNKNFNVVNSIDTVKGINEQIEILDVDEI